MKGFKDFVMRGNLVELAVAFVIATSFAEVVKTFTAIVLALVGKAGGNPDFNSWKPGGIPVGVFLTALVAFLILAFVVYFCVVKPYEAWRHPADGADVGGCSGRGGAAHRDPRRTTRPAPLSRSEGLD
jgi:large conductance mechanosensitive channel